MSVALKTIVDNGRERRSDGLFRHMGLVDAGSLRAQDNQTGVRSGAGLELLYDKPSLTSYIVSYDRDASLYRDLNIHGKNITITGQQGGKVILPAGTAQQYLGGFAGGSSYATSAGPWQESDIRATVTCTGGLIRIEWFTTILNTVAASLNYIGIGVDGAVNWDVGHVHTPQANYNTVVSGCGYMTPSAGVHRFSVFFGVSGGTLNVVNITNGLHLTEQRA